MKRYIYIIIGIIVVALAAIGILLFIKGRQSAGGTGGAALPPVGTQGTGGTGTTGTGGTSGTGSGGTPTTSGGTTGGAAASFGMISVNPVADYFVNAQNMV